MAKKARPAKAKSQRAKEPKSQRAKEPKSQRAKESLALNPDAKLSGTWIVYRGWAADCFQTLATRSAIVQPEPVRTAICRCAAADTGLRLRVTALKVG